MRWSTFAESHNMMVRGHTLLWHNQVSNWVTVATFTPAQIAKILQDHIATVLTATRRKSMHGTWSTKPSRQRHHAAHALVRPARHRRRAGTKYIEQALRWARAADPNAKLFYNDYDAEEINTKSDAIYAMAKDFKKRGVPLDGIGFQTHITLKFDEPGKLASYAENLERFAKLGLDLHITEMDVRLDDSSPPSLQAQAHLYGEITGLCLQQPSCKLIQTWGVTDKHSWIPGFYKG